MLLRKKSTISNLMARSSPRPSSSIATNLEPVPEESHAPRERANSKGSSLRQYVEREEELLDIIRKQKAQLRSHALVVSSLENTAAMHKNQNDLTQALHKKLQVRCSAR